MCIECGYLKEVKAKFLCPFLGLPHYVIGLDELVLFVNTPHIVVVVHRSHGLVKIKLVLSPQSSSGGICVLVTM